MKNAQPVELDSDINNQPKAGDPKAALIPLVVLVTTLPGFIYLWQDGHDWSWRNAFSSDGVPYAMVASGFVALIAAFLCFPKDRRKETGQHMLDGAASLMPALIILMLAWTLGSIFKSLEVAELIKNRLGNQLQPAYLPLSIFVLGTVMSFLTGTSWGTMGLLMPLALPLGLELGSELPPQELMSVITMTIGSVFGGAVFGDHCSPFSDTTIVSALAAGCSPTSHIATQLPYALIAAAGATLAYTLMALGLVSWLATLLLAGTLAAIVLLRKS
jgi:Na+/H+ antiporter NhaC